MIEDAVATPHVVVSV
jgi:hypothetical protein